MLSEQQLEKIITKLVDNWDFDTLYSFAVEQQCLHYIDNETEQIELVQSIGEDCPYCGGLCKFDEEHACDGWLGDIDELARRNEKHSV